MDENDTYVIEFLPAALHDISEIISSFVMLGSVKGAKRIKDKFNKAANRLSVYPYSGVTVPDGKLAGAGYRMVVVEKYLMFYRIFESDSKVIFYRVLNGARNYPHLFKGLETNE